MAKPNLSLTVYELLDLLPIIVLFPLVFISFVAYYIGVMCCISRGLITTGVSAFQKFLQGMTKLTMIVFGPPLGVVRYDRHKEEKVDHMKIPVVYIHKRPVPKFIVCMLGSYVISFIMFAITVFWDIFLLVQSSECDDTTIDCFAQTPNDTTKFEPVSDCSLYENYGSNVTITCYSFAYSFGPALGTIGGLFTMIKIVMKGISAVFLGLYGYAIDNDKACCFYFMNIFQIFAVILVPIGMPIGIIVITVGLPSLSYANLAQVLLAMFTMFIGFSIPWAVFTQPDSDENEGGEKETAPLTSPGGNTHGHGTINTEPS